MKKKTEDEDHEGYQPWAKNQYKNCHKIIKKEFKDLDDSKKEVPEMFLKHLLHRISDGANLKINTKLAIII